MQIVKSFFKKIFCFNYFSENPYFKEGSSSVSPKWFLWEKFNKLSSITSSDNKYDIKVIDYLINNSIILEDYIGLQNSPRVLRDRKSVV
jgi:hypothetical protein